MHGLGNASTACDFTAHNLVPSLLLLVFDKLDHQSTRLLMTQAVYVYIFISLQSWLCHYHIF